MRPGSFLVSRLGLASRHGLVARPGLGVLVVALGTLVVPFDSSVNFAFPYITRAFGLPIPAIQWVIIAYTLTYAALMLVFGRVGDMLGYRRIFLAGSGWSAVAFVLCAMAPGYGALLAARVMQGIGAALILSCGPALATSLYPEASRIRILGIYTMVIGLGGALGPPIAGLLVPIIGWPAVFWFRVPFAFCAFVLAWLLPADTRPTVREKFDAPGGILLVLAIGGMLLALNQLQHFSERRLWFAASAFACLLAVAAFIVQERRTQQPIINLRLFRDFDFSLLNAGHAALNLAGFSVLLLVPFYLSRFGGLDRVHHRIAAGLLARRNRIGGTARRATGCTHTTSAAGGDRRGRHGGRSGADRVSRCDACHSSTRRRDGLAGIWCRVVPGGVFRHRHSVHSTCGSWRCRQPGDDDAHGRCGHRRDCIDADVSDLARDSAGKRRGRSPGIPRRL